MATVRNTTGAVLAAALVLFTAGCGLPVDERVFTGETMGTTYMVKVVGPWFSGPGDEEIAQAIETTLEDVNNEMSTYIETSDISKVNRAKAGEAVAVSPSVMEVMNLARMVYERSGGAFDPTVGPLVNAWGFGPEGTPHQLPTDEELEELLDAVGFDKLTFDHELRTITKPHDKTYIDLSAIAKGHGVDRVAETLDDLGALNYMVEIGGEVRVSGKNKTGEFWSVGIEAPDPAKRALMTIVYMTGSREGGVASSGDYRNYYERDGQRYSHTIDPKTGRPAEHRLAAVTVTAKPCAAADAMATALMALGPERGMALAEQFNWDALFILHGENGGYEVRCSTAFGRRLDGPNAIAMAEEWAAL